MKKVIVLLMALCLLTTDAAFAEFIGNKNVQGDLVFNFSTSGWSMTGLTDTGREKETIVIPAEVDGMKVISISGAAFNGSKCKNIELPAADLDILSPYAAFEGNETLERIDLSNIRKIDHYTFTGCTNLKEIGPGNRIPNGYIGRGVFSNTGLEYVTIDRESFGPQGDSGTALSEDIFEDCKQLRTVYITDKVRRITGYNFTGCTEMDYLCFGTGLRALGMGTFYGCKNLRTAVFYGEPIELLTYKPTAYFEYLSDKTEVVQVGPFKYCDRLTIIGRAGEPYNSENSPYSYSFEEYADMAGIHFIPAVISRGEPSTIVAQAAQTATVTINGAAVPAYTVNGSVYVGESALKSLGFGMDWNGEARTTTVTKPEIVQWAVELNTNPAPYSIDVVSSDVKFMLNGFPIPALNVGNGESIIDVNALAEAVLY
ncbi:MAG: leucine-rich repeat domain-containing protein [Oscillospiraceae bacterium]|nr:leucine-rich repeat domain-containing protein [Oscillospiraceae bacterium]